MADAATEGRAGHAAEKPLAGVDVGRENALDVRVLWRCLGRTHELGEGHDVLLGILPAYLRRVVGAALVVRHLINPRAEADEPTERCVLRKDQEVGDAYLVEVGVAGEGEKARVLILPAEATDALGAGRRVGRVAARRLQHRHPYGLPVHLPAGSVDLVGGDVQERLVGDGLDEAVAERVQRRAEGSHLLRPRDGAAVADDARGVEGRHALLRLGPEERGRARVLGRYRAVVDERAAGRVNELGRAHLRRRARVGAAHVAAVAVQVVAGPEFVDLADGTRHRVLVTLAARLRVVDGPQPVRNLVHRREDELVGLERAGRRRGGGDGRALRDQPVGLVVEVRGRFGGRRRGRAGKADGSACPIVGDEGG